MCALQTHPHGKNKHHQYGFHYQQVKNITAADLLAYHQ
jgi:hypothetical protein